MLKYQSIINKLSYEEKIKLINNIREINIDNEELPNINHKYLTEIKYGNENILKSEEIITCWDNKLLEEYFNFVSKVAKQQNINIVSGVNASLTNSSNLSNKLTEDGVLMSSFLQSYVNGLSNSVLPIITHDSFSTSALSYLDNSFNERAARDLYLKPYQNICGNTNNFLFEINNNSYKNNDKIINIFNKDYTYNTLFVNSSDADVNFDSIRLNSSVEVSNFDEEKVNNILDKLLTLLEIEDNFEEESLNDEIITDVILKSTVLLKNEDLLPIKYKYNLNIIINDNNTNIDVDSFKFKYHNCGDIKILYKKDAALLNKIENGTLVLFFIDNNIDNYAISREDSNLISAIYAKDVNIIGVITNPNIIDTSFDNKMTALFKTCNESSRNIEALLDIIYGKFSPCGKTSITYPYNPSLLEKELTKAKTDGKTIGELIGYRYYNKINEKTKYPFGYGLTYTRFEYSDFNCSKDEISFFIKNCGLFEATETVQIYIGAENSFVPRAVKSLYTYRQITLRPNEIQKVKIKLSKDAYTKYNAINEKYETEKGIYDIYVNTSSEHNELRGRIAVDGTVFMPLDNERGIENKYVVEKTSKTKVKRKKSSKKNISFPLLLVISMLLLVAFLFIKNNIAKISCFALLFVINIILLIMFKKNKTAFQSTNNINDVVVDLNLDDLFKETEIKENLNYDIINETKTLSIDNDDNISIVQYNNDKLVDIYNDLHKLLTNRGILISKENLRQLLLGISSSKLVFVKNNNQELFDKLVDNINIYFNNEVFGPTILKDVKNLGIFKNDDETYNSLYKYIMHSTKYKSQMSFVSISGLNKDNIKEFKDIIEDCRYSKVDTTIVLDNKSLVLPKNIWYLLSYDDELNTLPSSYLLDATYINVQLDEIEEVKDDTILTEMDYYSFMYLLKNIRNDYSIKEEYYKKIDLLENYVNKFKSLVFDNKYYGQIEHILSCDLLITNNEFTSIDELLSIKIIPLIVNLLKDVNLSDEDSINNNLDEIFGEIIENSYITLNKLDKKVGL